MLAVLVPLVGCVPRESGEVRLKAAFWNPPGVDQEIVRRFEAAHPGVKVDLLVTGGRYAEKLQSMIVAGNEPDVLMVHDKFYQDWAARGVLADLTDFVREADRADPFMPDVLQAFARNGRFHALPVDCNAMVTFGNSRAAAYAPVAYPWREFSWEELERLGPRLTRRDNPDSPTEYLCALPMAQFFFTAFGGRCFDDLYHPREVVVESPVTIAALAYWRRLHQRGWAVPRSTMLDQGESEMFRDGRIAFLFWGRAVNRIVQANAALAWDIALVPAGMSGRRTIPHLSMGVGISRRSRHPELALEFLRFYASDAGVEYPVGIGQIVPVRRRQAASEAFLGRHPPASTQTYVDAMEGITATAYCPGQQLVDEIIGKRFEQALAEPDVPVAQIAASLGADLRAWLRRMQEKGFL